MDICDSVRPMTMLRTKVSKLLRQVRESGRPIIITQNGKPSVVIQDIESYQRQREALLMLKFLAKGDQEIHHGRGIGHAKAMKHFEKTLRKVNAK